ncbi:unnamed protein product [Cyprideis torosa]|uniref:glutathione transferase n=1 Tax=Cyprideis torosa TaxID=163714 RepID=A0A7R8VZW4_9CRUS|nr:unnamed protein product [Cyprideis torosa]CAG0879095.1 unnamed protein product [Cyprideis torosa]
MASTTGPASVPQSKATTSQEDVGATPKYRLHYFNRMGRAEARWVARLILAASGKKWEDRRISKEEGEAARAAFPFKQLPALEIVEERKVLVQANPIARYLAKELGLAGDTHWEAAVCDMVVDCLYDSLQHLVAWRSVKEKDQKDRLKKLLFEEELPRLFGELSEMINANPAKTGFVVGTRMTWADIALAHCLDLLDALNPGCLAPYPKMEMLKSKVFKVSTIEDYTRNRGRS